MEPRWITSTIYIFIEIFLFLTKLIEKEKDSADFPNSFGIGILFECIEPSEIPV